TNIEDVVTEIASRRGSWSAELLAAEPTQKATSVMLKKVQRLTVGKDGEKVDPVAGNAPNHTLELNFAMWL
ncbi:MAG: hypothetical protein LQ341_006854, partial [Variospora aurantia]